MTEAEAAWRAWRLDQLTKVAGMPAAMAQGIIEVEARWEPWVAITVRFPTLRNLARYGHSGA